MKNIFKITIGIFFLFQLNGCMVAPIVAMGAGAAVSQSTDFGGEKINISNLISNENIIYKRNLQTRKFIEKDLMKINQSLNSTLFSIGFTNNYYDDKKNFGMASGEKYSLQYFIKKYDKNIYMRVSIHSLKRNDKGIQKNYKDYWKKSGKVNPQDYKDFWNAIGKEKILQTNEISTDEI